MATYDTSVEKASLRIDRGRMASGIAGVGLGTGAYSLYRFLEMDGTFSDELIFVFSGSIALLLVLFALFGYPRGTRYHH
ncbi:MAG: hypothetical protein ACE5F4_01635 [Candidatus Paceibacteria bacterium]